ncbi:TRAP transporter substrate-binding protein [Massilia agilis]|uniref:TRAP transporter substrate-binding protein n=1 Tax=Massilia agilis TaxID=1811226 RepID=A0ABT2D8S3_9BURK|nr:TRAP transporter substrate-binding protein [Massilia agilis]MCS0807659.1 TRAP transporter substrate-binding protein [Massilia agilis]
MKLKHWVVLLGAFASAASAWAAPIVIKFSHVVATDTPKGKAAEYFKKIAEERTHGQVQVQVYPNSQLYKDKEELDALQMGAVQVLAPTFSKFGPLGVKEFEALDLPYLFDDMDMARKVTQGPVGQSLLAKLDAKGIEGLAFWDNAFKQMTANKPLKKPDDFRGMKIRIQSSKVMDAQMRALGANPQVMAFSEVYQALQTGVVDGQDNPYSNIYTQKFFEVQKYLSVTDHGYHAYVLIANKKFWDGLPPNLRSVMDGVVKDTTAYFNQIAAQEEADSLARIKASGRTQIVVLTKDEKLALKKAMLPVYKQVEPRVGKDVLESIYKATGSHPDKL